MYSYNIIENNGALRGGMVEVRGFRPLLFSGKRGISRYDIIYRG